MAVVIDEVWLKEQGIDAEGAEAENLIDMAMEELEMRAGMAIADKLSGKQIAEFEAIEDEDARIDWLEKALPTYPQIVEDKVAELQAELARSKDKTKLINKWAAS